MQELTKTSAAAYTGAWANYAAINNQLNFTPGHDSQEERPTAQQHMQEANDRVKQHLPHHTGPPTWTQMQQDPHQHSQKALTQRMYQDMQQKVIQDTTRTKRYSGAPPALQTELGSTRNPTVACRFRTCTT